MSDSDGDSLEETQSGVTQSGIELGFLETVPSWKLESRFFPSKVGKRPAWLALSDGIPCYTDLLCCSCNKPLIFLCQVYAPIETNDACFHRTLYVFVCKTDNCLKSNKDTGLRVYRSQLPRVNNFYPFDPPVEEECWRPDIHAESFGIKLCGVCGIKSTNCCGKCKIAYYCSKEHQAYDWKAGHKMICKQENEDRRLSDMTNVLFPEYEIITEPETDFMKENKGTDQTESTSNSTQFKGTLQDVQCEEELSKMSFGEEDRNFVKFHERIKCAPSQVIRYERNGLPLWISDDNLPSLEERIQDCQYCGGNRIYEFQIMPQMLNFLDVSHCSLDWGTLNVFTCEKSCNGGTDYKQEIIIKHDFCSTKK